MNFSTIYSYIGSYDTSMYLHGLLRSLDILIIAHGWEYALRLCLWRLTKRTLLIHRHLVSINARGGVEDHIRVIFCFELAEFWVV
jgi:hypothetical protein